PVHLTVRHLTDPDQLRHRRNQQPAAAGREHRTMNAQHAGTSTPHSADEAVRVENLSVVYEPVGAPVAQAVDDVSFSIDRGEFVGLVGESGSGKSTLGFAMTKLTRPPARITGGRIIVDGRDIAPLSAEELRSQRQGGFAMVLQAGMNALNPDRKSTRLNSSHVSISYAVFCLKKKKQNARDR